MEYVSKGYTDPVLVSKEYAGAKTSMMPFLKQWTSLPAMSYFLVNALGIREKTFHLKASWSFRPPPRVTLTDQKRESWLKDLANEQVPLRKLSRTIPHGIRNRALLEHCMSKDIPVPRAVWFAKCVGANELRGLKRKQSLGSEHKWVRDWTDEVCQFLDEVFLQFVSPSAEDVKLDYAFILASQLFQEDLLDSETFLDWCVQYFATCSTVAVPLALTLLRLFREALITGSRTQKLIKSILSRYDSIGELINILTHRQNTNDMTLMTNTNKIDLSSDKEQQALRNLQNKLTDYTLSLLEMCPDSFVQPANWEFIHSALQQMTIGKSPFEAYFQNIKARNEPLVIRSLVKTQESTAQNNICGPNSSSLSAIWRYLDEFEKDPPYNYSAVCAALQRIEGNTEQLLKAVYSWATNVERDAKEYFFLCVGLCQFGHSQLHWDIGQTFIAFLVEISRTEKYFMEQAFDLMEEFIRLDFVSPDQYLRKVISSGLIFSKQGREGASAQVGILHNLPFLSKDAEHQRNMLLRGINPKECCEANTNIEELAQSIFDVGKLHTQHPSHLNAATLQHLSKLPKGQKVAISDAMVEAFYNYLEEEEPNTGLIVYLEQIFTRIGCYRAYFHVVWLSVPRMQSSIDLYFLGVSLTPYARSLCALGKLDELLELIVERFRSLQPNNESLHWLAEIIEGMIPLIQNEHLRALLAKYVPVTTLDPNGLTPLSDSHSSTSVLSHDVEGELQDFMKQLKLKPSQLSHSVDTIMDIMFRSSKADTIENIQRVRLCAQTLRHLKLVNEAGMLSEPLTKKIKEFALTDDLFTLPVLISFCVAYGCLTATEVRSLHLEYPFFLLVNPYVSEFIGVEEAQAINVLSEFFHRGTNKSQRNIYLKGLCEVITNNYSSTHAAQRLLGSIELREFLQEANSLDPQSISEGLVNPCKATGSTEQLNIVRYLIRCTLGLDSHQQSFKDELFSLVNIYNDENKHLCQLQLNLAIDSIFSSGEPSAFAQNVIQLFREVESQLSSRSLYLDCVWELTCAMHLEAKGAILLEAETTFFSQATDIELLTILIDAAASAYSNESVLPSTWIQFTAYLEQMVASNSDSSNQTGDQLTEEAAKFLVKMLMIHAKAATSGAQRQKTVAQLVALVRTCMSQGISRLAVLLCDGLNTSCSCTLQIPQTYNSLANQQGDTASRSFMIHDKRNDNYYRFDPRPFDLLQEANPAMGPNDAPIDLTLFDSSLEKIRRRAHS